ncbi:hypothetical protein F5Y18DRAFT_326780 [Xylariaceae sp. FL1019]|nr:hypothetical protein F5Y18DRAFT_326780 [Xylariaceae sp. FL1019]
MADSGDHASQEVSTSLRPATRKERSRSQAAESLGDQKASGSKKYHKRSATAVNVVGATPARDQSPQNSKSNEDTDIALIKASDMPLGAASEKSREARRSRRASSNDPNSRSQSPPTESSDTVKPTKMNIASESEGSSGSSETITRGSPSKRESIGKTTDRSKRHINRPDALSFLDSDSPQVTAECIERTVHASSKFSPESAQSTSPSAHSTSSASSGFRDDRSETFGDHETDRSTSPECSVDGDPRGRLPVDANIRKKASKYRKSSYGTPEMPHGKVQLPHIPPEALTPRAPPQYRTMHLPRAEKLPLTGYELLASRLAATSNDRSGPCLRPMYRRFEMLNHRLLLHLQDEMCELEEQLHRLDTTDTQTRCLQSGIIPASRRAEAVSGGELQYHRTEVMSKIGFKLEQYNRVLASFRDTQSLPAPSLADVHEYRSFLSTYAPINDLETQFLDTTDDLVCVGEREMDMIADEDDLATPMPRPDMPMFNPRRRPSVSVLSQSDVSRRLDERSSVSQETLASTQMEKPAIAQISVAAAVAIILPIFTFLVIPGFLGRMTVASLVGGATLGALVQGNIVGLQATQELCVCIGLYGGVMALLAGVIG